MDVRDIAIIPHEVQEQGMQQAFQQRELEDLQQQVLEDHLEAYMSGQ